VPGAGSRRHRHPRGRCHAAAPHSDQHLERLDDFFTFMASRTEAFDEVDEFQAIRVAGLWS